MTSDYWGRCINRELFSEPDLINQIAGVLLQFREEQVAVIGDIDEIFQQVKVPDDQYCFFRILRRGDCDANIEIIDYKMTVHVFGGASSPLSSHFALRKTKSDNRSKYASDVTRILGRNFYVDDMLKSFQTVTEAKDVTRKFKDLCLKSNFNLNEFTNNSKEMLKSIPGKDRWKNVTDKPLTLNCQKIKL